MKKLYFIGSVPSRCLSDSVQRYRCKECAKTFNIKTKTPLARLHKCELWKQYTECMELKLTLRQAAKICNINLKTAFYGDIVFLMLNQNNIKINYLR